MDEDKVDEIIQFALAVAACEDDSKSRELGPIHLLKYVYIADLAYAERNHGETYTGTRWQFYKFGPWSQEVVNRIEPACLLIGADKILFEFTKKDSCGEGIRWKLDDSSIFDKLDNCLDIVVSSKVKSAVHEFGADTSRLLNYVYLTRPMLSASPGETLDFSTVVLPSKPEIEQKREHKTIKAQKRRKAELNEARIRMQQKLAQKKASECSKRRYIRKPRYDEIYFAGQELLDSLAGSQLPEIKGEVSFSDDIWKSGSRFDPEIP